MKYENYKTGINKTLDAFMFSNIILNNLLISWEKYSNWLKYKLTKDFNKLVKISEDNKIDSILLNSAFLELFPIRSEESLSDRLCWILEAKYVSNLEIRFKLVNFLINKILSFASLESANSFYKGNLKFNWSNQLEIHREYILYGKRSFDKKQPRLDILIEDKKNKNVLGIEIKNGDKNILKSQDDYFLLVKEFPQFSTGFILILPKMPNFNPEYKPKNKSNNYYNEKNITLPKVPLCTWTNVIRAVKLTQKYIINKNFNLISEFFISAIESNVLDFDTTRIYKTLNSKFAINLPEVNNYLSYRKEVESSY